jgi:DNA-binding MarR family transcriptional regulator
MIQEEDQTWHVNAPREELPEHEPPLPPALARWTGFLLAKLRQRSLELSLARLAGHAIRPRDWGILAVLGDTGARTQQELGDFLFVNRTVMVGVVDELEAAGLVERRRNPADRRAYAIELTATGRVAVTEGAPALEAADEELLRALSKPERARLAELLRKVLVAEGGAVPDVLAGRIGYLLALAEKRGLGTVQAALAEVGLRVPGNGVLTVLDDEGPRSQRELGDALRLNRSVMVQIVDELEAAAYLVRVRNPADRRAYALELTDAGRSKVTEAQDAIGGVHEALFGVLAPAEREELHTLALRAVEA